MNLFKVIRANEWWYSKLPPLLAIAFATASMSSAQELFKSSLWILFLLFSIIIGAIYVSVINDISDLDEDLASGKSNRIQKVPQKYRWLIPIFCFLVGVGVDFLIYPDILSSMLYFGPWITFSMYSLPPFRFKSRGICGVLCDALGSHLFLSLLMVSSLSYVTNQSINWIWFTSVGIWSFCYGLRGILYHQFMDRENDIKVNINTFASKIEPERFKLTSRIITFLEIISFGIMIFQLSKTIYLIALLLYISIIIIRRKTLGQKIIFILIPRNSPFQIFMADFYQTFFPISILIMSCFNYKQNILILIIFTILFPNTCIAVIKDCLRPLKIWAQ